MPPEKIQHHLASCPIFSELECDQLLELARKSHVISLHRDQMLFNKGDHLTDFYYVLHGMIALTISTPDGSEKIVDIEETGRTFGEALLFLDRPSPVGAKTLEPTELLTIPRKIILETMKESHLFTMQMLAGLSARLHHLVDDLEAYCMRTSTQRVASFLISLADKSSLSDNHSQVSLPVSKLVVASRLKLTPETFSRVLRDLAEDGFIKVNGKNIELIDIEALGMVNG